MLQDYLFGHKLKYKPYITLCLFVYNVLIYTSKSSLVASDAAQNSASTRGAGCLCQWCVLFHQRTPSVWNSLSQQPWQLLLASRLLGLTGVGIGVLPSSLVGQAWPGTAGMSLSVAPTVFAVHMARTLEKCMDPAGRGEAGCGSVGPLLLPFHFEAATPQQPHPGPKVSGVSGGAACAFLVLSGPGLSACV